MDTIIQYFKGAFKSWTMWFNAILATAYIWLPDALAQLPVIKTYLPDDLYKWVFVLLIVGNVLLRVKTTKSLADK